MPKLSKIAVIALAATVLHAQEAEVAEIELKPHASNPLGYDKTDLAVKVGQKIKLTLNNTGSIVPQPHNFLLLRKGKMPDNKDVIDAVGAQANLMMGDPQGMAKHYIPEASKADILAHTKLVQANGSDTIEFTAPAEEGDYAYICTFPGHWLLMRGVMHVTK
ncbi:MAG TPA: hypothetical protein DIT64_02705 [Verrucomicrobiales bacterium]|nr:hypothetical protein [Verrucomicrobiales bacterium]HCN78674.1 hypothetical protein [Verrucomicrobiales bacterium]HRJ08954.1 plastocyanin/azurin family copper-binding protein [Prosthecobacter sp.]HRK15506.1 plastocyanin/azurin family copper-binding protein [Prosthecobacter sp.]